MTTRASLISAAILFVPTLFIVLQGASDEPYVQFHFKDATSQVVGGTGLAMSWLYLAGHGLVGVIRNHWPKWTLAITLLAGLCAFILFDGAFGYLGDIDKFSKKIAVRSLDGDARTHGLRLNNSCFPAGQESNDIG